MIFISQIFKAIIISAYIIRIVYSNWCNTLLTGKRFIQSSIIWPYTSYTIETTYYFSHNCIKIITPQWHRPDGRHTTHLNVSYVLNWYSLCLDFSHIKSKFIDLTISYKQTEDQTTPFNNPIIYIRHKSCIW